MKALQAKASPYKAFMVASASDVISTLCSNARGMNRSKGQMLSNLSPVFSAIGRTFLPKFRCL